MLKLQIVLLFSSAAGRGDAGVEIALKTGKKNGAVEVRVIIIFMVSPSTCSSLYKCEEVEDCICCNA
jgi:hypothetical protein